MANSISLLVALGAVIVLLTNISPTSAETEGDSKPPEFDVSDMNPEVSFTYEIVGAKSSDVSRRWSNRTDDVDCEHNATFSVGGRSPSSEDLSRRGSPEKALYEWHLCFEINGRVYRGWRGFDPGPGSLVELDCRVDASQPPDDEYACVTKNLKLNPDNYGEAAHACRQGEPCRRFETLEEYAAWTALPDFTFDDALEAAAALIRHELAADSYLSKNPRSYYVAVNERDLPRAYCESLSGDSIRFHPASEQPDGSGMNMKIGNFIRRGDGTMEVSYSFYCGPLCASSHTAVMKKDETGEWKVISTEMHWIS